MRNRATLSPMNLAVRKPMTLAEFLAWEERQELRYEFDGSEPRRNGRRKPRPRRHSTNLALALGGRLRGKAMPILRQRPQDPGRGKSAVAIRTEWSFAPVARNPKIVRNPVVIFEVLSPSTAATTASSRRANIRRRLQSNAM